MGSTGVPLTIVMLGDVMLGRLVNEALSASLDDGKSMWGSGMLPLLQGGMAQPGGRQVVTGNLECAVCDYDKPVPKTFNFRLSPSNIGALKTACFRFAGLANNHCLDYDTEGLVETMHVLDAAGIKYAGVGTTSAASEPAIIEEAGMKLAFVSYSDHYTTWKATDTKLGINYIKPDSYDRLAVEKHILAAKALSDAVIVFIHWGPNWAWRPSNHIRDLAHTFIDCGATAVFGHSAHHVQGIEVYSKRPIIYGAGGFIDDYALNEEYRNDLGFLYALHIKDEHPVSLELVPSKITHTWQRRPGSRPPYFSHVNKAVGEDRAWVCRTVKRLSAEYGTQIVDTPRGLKILLSS